MSMKFIGVYASLNDVKNPSYGDLCIVNGREYIYIGRFESISYDVIEQPVYKPVTHMPTTCKNCGAPLEKGVCHYCGTDYRQ